MRNGKIDIIIPAYNVKDEMLFSCLSSISTQTLKDISTITIIDDASTEENYKEVIKHFSHILDINLLRYEVNGGPGVARQYGLDHTENEFITFIDADDLLASGFALERLKTLLDNNKKYEMAIGAFQEIGYINNILSTVNHLSDTIWMFGKLYRRSFINNYNIKFHPTSRANEDNGFNAQCKLYLRENLEYIGICNEIVYYWFPAENSITRRNNCEYAISIKKDASFYGYIENMIYAIQAVNNNPRMEDKNGLTIFAMRTMIGIYFLFLKMMTDPYNDKNFQTLIDYCSWYYEEIFIEFRQKISESEFIKIYNIELQNQNNQSPHYYKSIPTISFPDFLDLIKN